VFTEDLDAFLDTDEFALDATYNSATAVKVIFDAAYLEQLGIAGTGPVALGKASDFPAAAVGKTLAISSTTYTIRNREPQDDGAWVLLRLEA
jgi:hypothetical protein